jgi:peptidoglycan/LPS O-acetylase OafA/YrhL
MSIASDAPTAAAPAAVAPPPHHPRFPLVDGMRAIAALLVVIVHCAGFAGVTTGLAARLLMRANIGVTIFFLISGFLLYRPFIAYRTGGAVAPKVATYGKRRFLRIYPAYWLVLTAVLVLPGQPGTGGVPWLPMYSLTQTIPLYSHPACSALLVGCSLAQTWSLGAELTFYLALPVLAVLVERLTRGLRVRNWVIAQTAVLAGLSAASLLYQYLAYPTPNWVGWTVLGNVVWFSLGMGLAVASVLWSGDYRRHPVPAWIAAWGGLLWAAAIGGYVVLCLWLPASSLIFGAGHQLVVSLAFGLIALLLLAPVIFTDGRRGLPERIAGARVMAWLGLISYGIFLWHFPVLLVLWSHVTTNFYALLAAGLAITIPVSAASYYLLERPVMKLKYRRLLRR